MVIIVAITIIIISFIGISINMIVICISTSNSISISISMRNSICIITTIHLAKVGLETIHQEWQKFRNLHWTEKESSSGVTMDRSRSSGLLVLRDSVEIEKDEKKTPERGWR